MTKENWLRELEANGGLWNAVQQNARGLARRLHRDGFGRSTTEDLQQVGLLALFEELKRGGGLSASERGAVEERRAGFLAYAGQVMRRAMMRAGIDDKRRGVKGARASELPWFAGEVDEGEVAGVMVPEAEPASFLAAPKRSVGHFELVDVLGEGDSLAGYLGSASNATDLMATALLEIPRARWIARLGEMVNRTGATPRQRAGYERAIDELLQGDGEFLSRDEAARIVGEWLRAHPDVQCTTGKRGPKGFGPAQAAAALLRTRFRHWVGSGCDPEQARARASGLGTTARAALGKDTLRMVEDAAEWERVIEAAARRMEAHAAGGLAESAQRAAA